MDQYSVAFWGSVAQWASVGVAFVTGAGTLVIGILTFRNARQSRDAQDRATRAAADAPTHRDEFDRHDGTLEDVARARHDRPSVAWDVERQGGESWMLRNTGASYAIGVSIEGYTELDSQRLIAVPDPTDVAPGTFLTFTLVSRLTLSGPANIVVRYRISTDGEFMSQVLRVPSP